MSTTSGPNKNLILDFCQDDLSNLFLHFLEKDSRKSNFNDLLNLLTGQTVEEESERDNNNDLMNLLTGITVEEQSETIKDNENPCSGKRQFVYYFRIL